MARQKRILITGYNSQIGRSMTEWCLSEGWVTEGWVWTSDRDNWPHVEDYDWVIHLHELTSTDTDQILDQNFNFSCWLFHQCNQLGTNFQYASSNLVYGKTKNFDEFSECRPESPYAWTKFLFDHWVFQQENSIFVQGFRHFEVYGNYIANSVLHAYRSQAKEQGYITVPSNAERIKQDYVWVGDVCKLHIDFIKSVNGSGLWNCGTGLSHRLLDIAEEIAQQEQVEIQFADQVNINYSCANLTNLKKTIGKRKWLNVFEYIDYEKNKY